ncbi:30S ribosome-binding factor RbfA [Kaistia geumhonensis]|uniref:Ribosome-binding factor A n=1 Tax=Kaistia geumhonensis TaxID=410839 RepID=A0ABU0M815_9HYPH|nr:30S ribosome-binding factor RbfA [Kaistia geumhonensis]MCX5477874.1 30S ribosome-binding factor RbfA [Kaistia geumhonensis]MDQ0516913.1 ribosome-binding factor A [Kaistia geumhonensis]
MARTASNGKKIGTPGQRQLRVGELVRHALAEILARGELREPELERVVVTIPEVRLSPDLKIATAYVMPLGGQNVEGVVAALDRHRRFLRGEVAHRINMKFAPDLRFRVDTSFEQGSRIDALLRSDPVVRHDVEAAAEDGDDDDGGVDETRQG